MDDFLRCSIAVSLTFITIIQLFFFSHVLSSPFLFLTNKKRAISWESILKKTAFAVFFNTLAFDFARHSRSFLFFIFPYELLSRKYETPFGLNLCQTTHAINSCKWAWHVHQIFLTPHDRSAFLTSKNPCEIIFERLHFHHNISLLSFSNGSIPTFWITSFPFLYKKRTTCHKVHQIGHTGSSFNILFNICDVRHACADTSTSKVRKRKDAPLLWRFAGNWSPALLLARAKYIYLGRSTT